MRVAIINEVRGWGGAEVHCLELARSLAVAGVEVRVVGNTDSELSRRSQEAGLPTHEVAMASEMDAGAVLKLRKIEVDVLHAHTMRDHVLAAAACGLSGRPLVRTQHIHFPPAPGPLAHQAYHRGTRRILCVSEFIRGHLVRHGRVADDLLEVVPHGIDADRFAAAERSSDLRSKWGIPEESLAAGVMGSLFATKGQEHLLRALPLLPPQVHAVLIGDGPERSRLEALAGELQVADRVHLVGFTSDPATAWRSLDFGVVPSVWEEPAGLVVLEAQAAGLPVVASRIGGIPELLCHEATGLLVPPADAAALAGALNWLLQHPAKSRSMGAAGQEHVRAHFTLDRMARDVERVYRQVTRP